MSRKRRILIWGCLALGLLAAGAAVFLNARRRVPYADKMEAAARLHQGIG